MKIVKRILLIILIVFSAVSVLWLSKIYFFPSEYFCTHLNITQTLIPPTCTLQGYTVYSCDDCSYFAHSDFVDPIPHDLTYEAIEPSCTKAGFTSVICSVCKYSYKESYTEPLNHTIKSKTVDPDCENLGYTEYFCVNCEFSYKADEISADTHDYVSSLTAPTCTEEGYTTLSCTLCDSKIYTEYVKPTGHDYIDTKIHVTSVSDGHTITTCSSCDLSEISEIVYSKDVYTGARTGSDDFIAYGIDVSKHNDALSWSILKNEGVEFAILRAANNVTTEFKDPSFEYNYANAKANGIDEIYATVERLLPILEGKKFEYPIFFDLEKDSLKGLGKDLLTEMCVTFITELQSHGYFAALYTNENWLINFYHTETVSTLFDIWYARYPGIEEPEWSISKYGEKLCMWQYSEDGVIAGHSCKFDLNYSYKNYPKIMKRFHLNGY